MPFWFYMNDGQPQGPFKGAEFLELVRTQAITAATMVRKDESAWFPAGEVGGLFAAAAKPTVEHVVEGYEKSEANQRPVSESWKQWVRRLKLQRDERLGGGPPRPQ